jgi:hypothetical protein
MAVYGLKGAWAWPAAVVRARALTPAAELQRLGDEFRQIALDAAALTAPLTEAQFAWRPAPDAWSVGECLSHLNVTARLSLVRIDEAICDGLRDNVYGSGPFRYGWIDRLILHATEPPSRWHVGAPALLHPVSGQARDEVLLAFRAFQDQFIDRLRRADGLHLARVRVTSPVARWRRFSLGAAFAVLAAHERRHLVQARRVTALPQFPR